MGHPFVPSHPRSEWVRRFADWAVLVDPSFDPDSALMVADGQFDDAGDLEPEQAAQIFVAPH